MTRRMLLITAAGLCLLLTMACNLFSVLLPDEVVYQLFESDHGDVEEQIMTTAFPGSLDEPEEAEPIVEFGGVSADESSSENGNDGLELTPEEALNQGTHHYKITGTTTFTVFNDGTIDDENNTTHEFTQDGVTMTWGVLEPKFYTKSGHNTYTYVDENVEETVRYTATGFEYDQIGSGGVENYFIGTLDE